VFSFLSFIVAIMVSNLVSEVTLGSALKIECATGCNLI